MAAQWPAVNASGVIYPCVPFDESCSPLIIALFSSIVFGHSLLPRLVANPARVQRALAGMLEAIASDPVAP